MDISKLGRIFALTAAVATSVALIACGDGPDPEPTPTTAAATPTATIKPAESSATAPGPGTRPPGTVSTPAPATTVVPARPIGVASLDTIAAAVTKADVPAVLGAIQYSEIACTTAQGLGGPPKCAAGEASGTVVKVLPYSACEREYLRASNATGLLTLQLKSPALHSAFRTKDAGTAEFPLGTYGVVFDIEGGGFMLGVNDAGKIVSIVRGCAGTADQLFEQQKGSEVLLAP